MKKQINWLMVLSVLLLPIFSQAVKAGETRVEKANISQFIIKYRDSTVQVNNVNRLRSLSTNGSRLNYHRAMSGHAHVLKTANLMTISEANVLAKKIMMTDSSIEYVEPDRILHHFMVPNDTRYAEQWSHSAANGMNTEAAWNTTTGSASTVVAVIDTGVLNHVDLVGKILPGYDMISDASMSNDGDGRDADARDPGDFFTKDDGTVATSSWHGTHVAGIIAATTNNSAGMAGVDWNAKVLPVRVLGAGGGFTSDIVDGMTWAYGGDVPGVPSNPNPAKVLNLSLGGSGVCSFLQQEAINGAVAAGAIVVVAAGNEDVNVSGSNPGNCNNVITVAAHGPAKNITSYSNYGNLIDIMAPGGEMYTTGHSASDGILSTLDGGQTTPLNDNVYVYYQGTSMATPNVAGVVSLMLAVNSQLVHSQVLSIMKQTSQTFPAGTNCATNNFQGVCGAGIIDAAAAVQGVSGAPAPAPAPTTDDHGNSMASASLINATSSRSGSIEIAGDNDYFRINLTSGGTLTLNSTGTTDTYGYLLDSSGTEISSNDDTTGDNTNFMISSNVVAGTYYVRVRGYSSSSVGSYTLVSSFASDGTAPIPTPNPSTSDDHGDSISAASTIGSNSSTSGSIEIAGDNDYFRIDLTSSGTLTLNSTGTTDTYGYLLDSSGNEISSNDDASLRNLNFLITSTVTAGTYYVRVRGYSTSTGNYTLASLFVPSQNAPTPLPTPKPTLPIPGVGGGGALNPAMLLGMIFVGYLLRRKSKY